MTREGILLELVRQAERILDQQVRAVEAQDAKSQHMLAVGVAALGGGSALALFALTNLPAAIDFAFLGLVALGGSMNVGSLWLFVRAYAGGGFAGPQGGPSLDWLRGSMRRRWYAPFFD